MHKILVVEDFQEVSEFLALALMGDSRYEVVTAANGNEAASLLQLLQPDLALIDVLIPGLQGIEMGRRAVALNVPVLLMTGDFVISGQLTERISPISSSPSTSQTYSPRSNGSWRGRRRIAGCCADPWLA